MKPVLLLLSCILLIACATDPNARSESNLPTDAEVEAYNAQVPPEERIVCRLETPVGTYIRKRVCRLQGDMDATSTYHRSELRRVLR